MTYLHTPVYSLQNLFKKKRIEDNGAFTAFHSCFKMDDAQARVSKAVSTMVSSLDKDSLRKLQVSATEAP